MEPNHDDGESDAETVTLKAGIDQFVSSGAKSGNYQANCEYILNRFATFLRNRGIRTIPNVSPKHVAAYASELHDDDDLANSSVWSYIDVISAFLNYASRWDWVDDNHAKTEIVKNELPNRPTPDSSDQQFWTPEKRSQLIDYIDRETANAVDEKGLNAQTELRNKVLIYLLAYSGVRGGEILNDPRDDRRSGLTWGDVDTEQGVISILGKNQDRETAPLPKQVHHPLEQLERAVQPPTEDWPVIFSSHRPTLYGRLPDGFDPDSSGGETPLDYCKETGTIPPALSTNGGRNLMQRICSEAEIDIDGEYLKPHGGRRGVGEKLYRNKGSAAAQRALRHADPRTTSRMYSHIESSELADDIGDVFDSE